MIDELFVVINLWFTSCEQSVYRSDGALCATPMTTACLLADSSGSGVWNEIIPLLARGSVQRIMISASTLLERCKEEVSATLNVYLLTSYASLTRINKHSVQFLFMCVWAFIEKISWVDQNLKGTTPGQKMPCSSSHRTSLSERE